LAVNNKTRGEEQECVRAVKAFKSLRLDKTSIKCQVGSSFAVQCFLVHRGVYGMDSAEYASEATHCFGSWSSVCMKIGCSVSLGLF